MPCPAPPTGAALVLLQQRLAAAEAALDSMLTGGKPTEITTQGDTVKFARTSPDDLRTYIAQLKAEIDGRSLSGAIGFSWG